MEEKKYELTDETIEWKGHILHRIKALKEIFKILINSKFSKCKFNINWCSCIKIRSIKTNIIIMGKFNYGYFCSISFGNRAC